MSAGVRALICATLLGACSEGGPRLDKCHPEFGSVAGGDDVTLVGSGFAPGVTVRFGRKAAKVVSVRDDGVEVKAPPTNETGPVDVTLILADGRSLLLRNGFRYVEAGQNPLERAAPPPR